MKNIVNFIKCEDGTAAVEYALLAALISVVAVAAMSSVGGGLGATFNKVAAALSTPAGR